MHEQKQFFQNTSKEVEKAVLLMVKPFVSISSLDDSKKSKKIKKKMKKGVDI